MTLSDEINQEVDFRKMQGLMEAGDNLLDEILNAPVVIVCSQCHLSQNFYNEVCMNCGREL